MSSLRFLFRHHLQIISEIICQSTESNRCEKVDGESGVAWIVSWEQSAEIALQSCILKSGVELFNSHELSQFLKQNLNEDPA